MGDDGGLKSELARLELVSTRIIYCLSDLFLCQGAAICGMKVRTSHLSSVPATG